jgi:hypothetical protein
MAALLRLHQLQNKMLIVTRFNDFLFVQFSIKLFQQPREEKKNG